MKLTPEVVLCTHSGIYITPEMVLGPPKKRRPPVTTITLPAMLCAGVITFAAVPKEALRIPKDVYQVSPVTITAQLPAMVSTVEMPVVIQPVEEPVPEPVPETVTEPIQQPEISVEAEAVIPPEPELQVMEENKESPPEEPIMEEPEITPAEPVEEPPVTPPAENPSNETIVQETPAPAMDVQESYTGFVGADGTVDESYQRRVDEILTTYLPVSVLNAFKGSGWTLEVTSHDIASYYCNGIYGNSVMGLTIYGDNRILIEDRRKAVEEAPIHEMGHWVDFYLGDIAGTEEFQSIRDSECATFERAFNYHYLFDNRELFAEAFSMYFYSNGKLLENCPRLYHSIEAALAQFG